MVPGIPSHHHASKKLSAQFRANDSRKPGTAWPGVLPSTADLDAYVAKAAEDEKARVQTSK